MDPRALTRNLHCACKSEFLAIRQVLLDISAFLQAHDVDQNTLDDVQLVLAEAMTNIARHAYPDAVDQICLDLSVNHEEVTCRLSDHGLAFDPTGVGQTPPDLASRKEGGYGWFIIRSLTKHLTYARFGNRNILSFSIARAQRD